MRHGKGVRARPPFGLQPDDFLIEFGKRIREARTARGLTQEELARKLKIDPAQISLIEGAQREPRLRTVFRIAVALSIEPRDLLPLVRR